MKTPEAAVTRGPDDDGGRARWDDRYQAREAAASAARPEPPPSLRRLASLLPLAGRAVDLAGGDGGGGLFLASRGLETTVVDVSPVALDRAMTFAAREGLPLTTVEADLGRVDLAEVLLACGRPAPTVITCFNYLDRALLASLAADLPPGCRFLVAIATSANLERHPRPSARFLLDHGELASLVIGSGAPRLRVLHRREGWAEEGHRAELVVEAT